MKLNGAFTVAGTSAWKHEQNRKGEPSYKNQKKNTMGKGTSSTNHLNLFSGRVQAFSFPCNMVLV